MAPPLLCPIPDRIGGSLRRLGKQAAQARPATPTSRDRQIKKGEQLMITIGIVYLAGFAVLLECIARAPLVDE